LKKEANDTCYTNKRTYDKRTYAALVTEQLDILSNHSKLMYTRNISQELIARHLNNMIRIISVNLEYGNSSISSTKDIKELNLEINTFLKRSFGKGQIPLEIYEKNRLHLTNVLSSCNRLPTEFIREMVSQLSEQL
jgi:hypothetical protein